MLRSSGGYRNSTYRPCPLCAHYERRAKEETTNAAPTERADQGTFGAAYGCAVYASTMYDIVATDDHRVKLVGPGDREGFWINKWQVQLVPRNEPMAERREQATFGAEDSL